MQPYLTHGDLRSLQNVGPWYHEGVGSRQVWGFSGFRFSVLGSGFRFRVFGFRFQVSESRFGFCLGFRFRVLGF